MSRITSNDNHPRAPMKFMKKSTNTNIKKKHNISIVVERCIYKSSQMLRLSVNSRSPFRTIWHSYFSNSTIKMFLKFVLICILFQCDLLHAEKLDILNRRSNHRPTDPVNQMAGTIVSKCYADIGETVIHGDSQQSTIKSLRESVSFPAIIYNDASLVDEPVKLRLHQNSFVMTPYSVSQLSKILLSFKESLRWNVNAPFIIFDNSNRGCKSSRQMLKLMWTMNLVKSYFLCVDSESKSMVYTFNPYTNRAPQEWQQIWKSVKKSQGWTMYRRQYDEKSICRGFDFDRTKYLDGSPIKMAIKIRQPNDLVPYRNYNESILAQIWPDNIYLMERLKYCLNVTLIFNIERRQELSDYMKDGTCDVLLRYMVLYDGPHPTHPVFYPEYHIVTNNRGFYTPWENIGKFFGLVTLISLCVILPITFIVILFSANARRWSFAGFEILRLLINAALHTRMDTIALRIFFSSIFLYFLILHAMFQGHIVKFLMKQEYRANAETLNDLRDSRYKSIYIHWTLDKHITDPILRQKLIPGKSDCVHEIIGNESVVCITTRVNFIYPAFEYKLHVSKNPVLRLTNYHGIRNDWPLEERFNKFLMWLEASGQSAYMWRRKYDEKILDRQKREKAKAAPADIRPISLGMLDWIFAILLIGLKLAAMSLTMERRARCQATLRRQNKEAERRNMARRDLMNKIIADLDVAAGSRPQSI